MNDKLLTLAEVAARLRVSKATASRLVRKERISHCLVAGSRKLLRVEEKALENYIRGRLEVTCRTYTGAGKSGGFGTMIGKGSATTSPAAAQTGEQQRPTSDSAKPRLTVLPRAPRGGRATQ